VDIEPKNCMSAVKAAAKLGLHPSHVSQMCKKGKLKGAVQMQIGGKWFIPEETVENYHAPTQSEALKKGWEKRKARAREAKAAQEAELQETIRKAKEQESKG